MHRITPIWLLLPLFVALLLPGCRSPQVTEEDITISITADGDSRNVKVAAGSTVSQALQAAGLAFSELDRIE
ncbi:MAG TPA: ubiquitin-like domain-containing protein, partial [Anaerolineales bacterium]|nr:ubiquitin-like domain-containing protein [Anaerolineales bacterium]